MVVPTQQGLFPAQSSYESDVGWMASQTTSRGSMEESDTAVEVFLVPAVSPSLRLGGGFFISDSSGTAQLGPTARRTREPLSAPCLPFLLPWYGVSDMDVFSREWRDFLVLS